MRPRALASALFVGLAVALGAPRGAAAATPTGAAEPVALTYGAPPGCPDRAALVASLRGLAPDVPLDDRAGRRLTLTIERRADGTFLGRLQVSDAPGSARPFEAPTCLEVADALALAASLALAPEAPLPDSRATTPRPPRPPKSSPMDTRRPPRTRSTSTSRQPPARWRPFLEAGVVAAGAAAPSVAIGGDVALGLALARTGRPAGSLRWDLALGLSYQDDAATRGTDGAQIRLLAGILRGCGAILIGPLDAGLCVRVDAGSWSATGPAVTPATGEATRAQASEEPWLTASSGPVVRLALTDRVLLRAQGGLLVPMRRFPVIVDDGDGRVVELIHGVPEVSFQVTAGVSVLLF